ncbi:site-specific recombinase XerD [Paenibacillus phyllosphaerae]|uniref:Site-specific recombinase XerD n=1 Tax=Paenibacillus phyllosphaerae TaxID=274593 RepID=A0A7W5FLK8_9BACL|nr:tyrosine-type recombinase/integrase [Paenibacillus phyllosphaerae]MBB3109094.1 site-specific recombinase XerD [Paenibacillus phyllosphaerae]
MARVGKIKQTVEFKWQEALEQFMFFKKAQGISQQTISDYKQHVNQFFNRYPNASSSEELLKVGLYEYFAQDDIKAATFNNRLVYIRTFLNWCYSENMISENPLRGFKKRKDSGRVVNIDLDTLRKLLSLPDKNTYAGLRDYTLMLLTLDSGIRPKEAFSLVIDDFNPVSHEIYIRSEHAKTRVSRTLPISVQTVKAIKSLVQARSTDWDQIHVPLFCTFEGKKMNRHNWGDRLEVYSKVLGVHIRPYDLRHVFALEFIRNGANALMLQKTLGHSDLSMTKRYVALTNNDLKEGHSISTPLKNLLSNTSRVRKLDK